MLRQISLSILFVFTCLILLLSYLDKRKTRKKHTYPPISFLVPCYNDGDTIVLTIKSIYASYPKEKIQLIVINDKSIDDSVDHIRELSQTYDFLFIDQSVNTGKATALNTASKHAIYDLLCFVDADVILNEKALTDMLDRLETNPSVGAVSCPYWPANAGWRPRMQSIEYTMSKYIAGAYNMTAVTGMRGGCICIRKKAFLEAGLFSLNAIAEDMDLAFKLIKHNRRVQHTFYHVVTKVPDTLYTWYKQKLRRTAGGIQNFIRYFDIWVKNPIHVLFVFFFSLCNLMGFFGFVYNIIVLGNILDFVITLVHIVGFYNGMSFINFFYGDNAVASTLQALSYTLFSLPYTFSNIKKPRQRRKVFYIFPYALVYVPLYAFVWFFGTWIGIYKYFVLKPGMRAW